MADTLRDAAVESFRSSFGAEPEIVVFAPGRVNLIGEHTDYNAGFVLPFALPYRTVIAASAGGPDGAEGDCEVVSESVQDPADKRARFHADASLSRGSPEWCNYIKGTIFQYLGDLPGGTIALRAAVACDVPIGSGLSSSAALEVATATMIEQLAKLDTPKVTKALRCQKAEHTFAGMPCGIMDQYVSAMGAHSRLLLIDCRSNECELIPFGVEASSETYKLVVANSNVKHKLSDSEYPVRVAQCKEAVRALQSAYPAIEALRDATLEQLEAVRSSMSDVAYKRAKHNITENARTQAAVEALKNANFVDVGKNMTESHVSLRDDYEVSCPELDALVDIAVSVPGVLGSRMTGGGFGGCTITLVEANAVDALLQALHSEYPKRSGHDTTTFVVSPSAGAGVV